MDFNRMMDDMPDKLQHLIALLVACMILLLLMSAVILVLFIITRFSRIEEKDKYVKEIESFVVMIRDSDISQKVKSLVEVLQKVPKHYFDEGRLGRNYIPELLSLLEAYCNLSEKDEAAKANILESIEVVTGASKSILGDLDENEKMKLEINSNVLSQMAKMDGYLSDTTLKEKTYPAS